MTRRLLILYLLIVFGPLVLASAVFAARDVLTRRRTVQSEDNGHGEAEGLEHTVEEIRAP